MAKIIVETTKVEDIPLLMIKEEDKENCPLVFFSHGFTSDKKQGLLFGYELAKKGFCFVALDSKMHGDRFDPLFEKMLSGNADYLYPFESGLDTFLLMQEIILQTGKDIDLLIEHFKGDPSVKKDAIGLTGYSMGGYAAFYIAARNPDIQAAVPIAGVPAFEARWNDAVLEASTYPEWSEKIESVSSEIESQTAFMQENDPFESLLDFHPKPLLMISGDLDTDCPKKYSVDLYRKLKPVYQDIPERLQLRIHDGVGHQLTPGMIQDACDWFERYL
jgi:dienelactone hydrolase